MRYCYLYRDGRHFLNALGSNFLLFGGYMFVYLSSTVHIAIEGVFCPGGPSSSYREYRDADLLSNAELKHTQTRLFILVP
jgi:hypothetical protein